MVFLKQLIDGAMDSSGQAGLLEGLSRALESNSLTALLLVDPKGHIVAVSQAACRLIQCTSDQASPLTMFNILADHAQLNQVLSDRDSKEHLPTDYQWGDNLQRLDGSRVAVRLSASWLGHHLVLFHAAEISNSDAQNREIEALKQQVAALEDKIAAYKSETDTLKQAERLYRSAFNQTFQLSSLLTVEGIILEDNKTALDFCRISREETTGKQFSELHCWQISPAVKQRIQTAILRAGQGETIRFETDILDPDHNIVTIDFSLNPSLDEAGNIEFLIAEGRDVTARKRAERSLQASEARFRSIFENMPLVGVILDRQANILFANRFFLELTGWPREAILHQNWFDWFIPKSKQAELYRQTFNPPLQNEPASTHYEYAILTRWGEERLISWRLTALAVSTDGRKELACIGEDITERRRGERALQQQTVQEQLLADITHQVRQSLDLDIIAKTAVNQIQQALQAEQVLVYRLNCDGDGQIVASSDPDQGMAWPLRPTISSNFSPDFSQTERPQYVLPGRWPQMVDAPIVRQADNGECQIWGLLIVYLRYPADDFIEVEWFLRQLANQLAVAIHQSELYHQAQTELANRQQVAERFRHDALHDALTGLPNYPYLLEHLSALMDAAPSTPAEGQFAVLFLDLNDFKAINDTFGHSLGDQLLRVVAQRLRTCIRETDLVARRSGDEFLFLLHPIESSKEAVEVARRVEQALKQPISFKHQRLTVSGSIGIVLGPQNYAEADAILQDADTAMYEAKGKGIAHCLWPSSSDAEEPG